MEDLISRQHLYEKAATLEAQAMDYVAKLSERDGDEYSTEWKIWSAILTERTAFKHDIYDAPSAQQWHVITKRPMTDDERKEWSERLGYDIDGWEAYIFGNLPDDGQEVIVSTQYGRVYIDTFCQDDGCYFEENGDMDGIVAWMELPEPYKESE